MLEINKRGIDIIVNEVRKNKIVGITRDIAKNFPWLCIDQDFNDFFKKVSEKVLNFENFGIQQEECLKFHLNLMATIGCSFLEDENFKWFKDFYEDNDYLPELDFSKKLEEYLAQYKNDVLGTDYLYLKKAINCLSNDYRNLTIKQLYPEKYLYLKNMNYSINESNELDNKIEFVFGKNWNENNFFSTKIKNNNDFLQKLGRNYVG